MGHFARRTVSVDKDTWYVAGVIVFLLGTAWGAVALFISAWEEYATKKRADLFATELAAAVVHSQPSWDEIKVMAETSKVSTSEVAEICSRLLKDILTGKAQELTQYKELVAGYRRSHQEAEPFEGLPSGVRIHMERVRETLADRKDILEPVTSQMRSLFAMHSRESKIQKRYTAWVFFLALLGVLFAAYTYVRPLPGSSGAPRESITQQK